jgi:hypothetical protein
VSDILRRITIKSTQRRLAATNASESILISILYFIWLIPWPEYQRKKKRGRPLWLLIDDGEIHSKYRNGSESPPAGEQYASEFEAFKKTPYGQKAAYGPDSDQNAREVEDYKNVRDLKKMRSISK